MLIVAPGFYFFTRFSVKRLDEWVTQYEKELIFARVKYSNSFIWPDSMLPEIVAKMKIAFEKGIFNKDSHAIRATCKHFGIPCTFSAIKKFLKDEPEEVTVGDYRTN